jgi:hypothetical protein
MPGFLSVEQYNRIVSKVHSFAGKQFDHDVDTTSNDLERVGLAGGIGAALEKAGWVQVPSLSPEPVAPGFCRISARRKGAARRRPLLPISTRSAARSSCW